MTEPAEGRAGVQVIARAAEMLRALQSAPGGLTQAELGDRLGLARSTIHRILGALEEEGLVAASRSRGRYLLGPQIPRMADAVRRDLLGRIHPSLQELSRALDETVDLSVLDGHRVTFLDQVVAQQRLRAVSAVGEAFPLHSCAPGKAILAVLPPVALSAALPAHLPALTPHTVTSLAVLRRELAVVRQEGFAYDREEHTEGICAVGAVIDADEAAPMAVSIPLPAQRFHGREPELALALVQACADIRAELSGG